MRRRMPSTVPPGRARSGDARATRLGATIATAALLAVGACAPEGRRSDTVVYASGADLESANPLTTVHPLARQVQRYALFVTLARLDSALQPQPYFARGWEWSLDRRTLTFRLVRGLRWHDGAPTTAEDVVFTLDAARDPATGYARAADLDGIDSLRAIGDSAVVLHFRRPPPGFPEVLAELPIAPAHLLASTPRGDLRRAPFDFAPVGNGPFRFVRREPGRRWIFERVDDFPVVLGGRAGVERLVIAVVDEPTTKFAGLVSGDLDVAGIGPTMVALVRRDPTLRVVTYPVNYSSALVFNTHRPPFDDRRVRRAVDALFDRQRIVDAALAGFGTPAAGALPSDHPLFVPIARPSAQQADSLLDAAGWTPGRDGIRERDGAPFRFDMLTVGSGDNAIEQLMQADLRSHGIDVRIRQSEMGAFLADARATPRRFDALFTGIPGDLSLSQLASMFDGRLAGSALDYGDFHTASLDSLFARVRDATSDDALASAWRDVQRRLADDVPVSWIYHSRGVQGLTRRLQGVRMDLRGEMPTLARWHLAPLVPASTP